MLTSGTPAGTYYLGDKLNNAGTWYIQYEIGQGSWVQADAGIGTSNTDPSAWSWSTANWYEDGTNPNKRVQADFGNFQFTSTGNWYFNGRVKNAAPDPFSYANNTTWQNTNTFAPAYYFTVNALNDPSAQAATSVSSSQIDLTWTKNAQNQNVMIVRKKSTESWTEPTQGTAYAVGGNIGSGVVVYNSSGTSMNNTGLDANTAYDYKFYSENYSYYSTGVTASATTRPTAFNVTGSGVYCTGGVGLPVGVDNSETGVTYTINPGGETVTGTGSSISFGNKTAGTYTVTGTNAGGSTPMTGSAVITGELQPPQITTCPPSYTLNGCNTGAITGLVYSETAVEVTQADFVAAGGVATDNCGITYYGYQDVSSGTCPVIVTRTWTVKDGAGNTTTCVQTITIEHQTAPAEFGGPVASSSTVECISSATAPITLPVVKDMCGTTLSPSGPTVGGTYTSCEGTRTYSYTYTDCANLTYTWVYTYTIDDTQAPTVSSTTYGLPLGENPDIDNYACGATYNFNTGSTSCFVTKTITRPVWLDNCGGTVLRGQSATNGVALSVSPGTPGFVTGNFPAGTTIITFTGTDCAGNIGTCLLTIVVTDNVLPTLVSCPANPVVNAEPGVCSALVALVSPVASDNCAITSITHNATGATTFSGTGFLGSHTFNGGVNSGVTNVTYTVSDGTNTASCNFTVTVVDNQKPSITCAGPISVNTDPGVCTYASSQLTAPPATDNCSVVSVLPSSASLILGPNTVTWTATDIGGNTKTCTQSVTVIDNQLPVITCAGAINVNADPGVCTYASSQLTAPPATDNCSVVSVLPSPATLVLGANTVTWTATDGSGNTQSCTQQVTVIDNQLPVISGCPGNIVQANDVGLCSAAVFWTEPTATDNCTAPGSLVWNKSHLPDASFPVGTTTVTYTAKDESNNTSLACSFTVKVNDTEKPVIAGCSGNIVQANDVGLCSAAVFWTEPTATDNCTAPGSLVWNKSHLPDASFPVGQTSVLYTAKDESNNTSLDCTFTVTVNDTEKPVIAGCSGNIVQANDVGLCSAAVFWTEPTATDNCTAPGSLVWNKSHLPGATFPVGGSTTITYTATDLANNTSIACTFTVTVNDTEQPSITCPAAIVTTTNSCYATVSSLGTPTTGDNCGVLSVVNDHPSDQYPVGVTTVTWTVADVNSNTKTCTQLVTVGSTSGALYVNDNSILGDVYTTAVGDDINGNGTSCAPFATITKAINQAVPGNTIYVDAGTIADDVVVNKQLTILGTNKDNDACSGMRIAESVIVPKTNAVSSGEIFHVAASNVTIKGFTIDGDNPAFPANGYGFSGADMHAAEGVTVYETGINNLTVSNNIIKNLSYFGVTLYDYPAGVPSSGHVISNNKIMDMGTYDPTSGISFWGGGVLLYNNQYTAVTNNCMTNVRLGVQTGNFSQINPGTSGSQIISGNTISARRRGIFHNLFYNASPYTISGNTITGIPSVNETAVWDGILLSSMQSVASTVTGNFINGSAISIPTTGISVWNCQVAPVISGGTIDGVGLGINVNNYEGYPSTGSNAGNTSAIIDGVIISGSTIAGVRVNDNPLNTNGAKVFAEIKNLSGTGNATGIMVNGADAGANIHDNNFTANAIGINVNGPVLSSTNSLAIQNNIITLTDQIAGTNPTTGIVLANISGPQAATVSGNNITGPYYGYFVYNLNTTPVTSINGGSITGIMQGLAAVNVDPVTGTTFAPSSFNADGITMSGFTGDYPAQTGRNFHAGVYVFTGGSSAIDKITANINNVSVTGTGKIAQDCAGMSFADFSTGAGNRQNIIITACNITDNKNRGINVRGANALVDIGTSTFTGNGSDPFGIDGNVGFGIIGRINAVLNIHNNFISNPASTTLPVTAILTDGATITAIENNFNNNSNVNGMIAVSSGSTFNTTCNWWSGAVSEAGIAAYISGPVTYPTWLMSPVDDDGLAAGFQPNPLSCYGTPITLTCVPDQTEAACQTQAAIDGKFAIWLATTTATGCNGVLTKDPATPVAPSACGGSTSVTWTYTTDCGILTCTKTFTVTLDLTAPTVTAPTGSDIECSTGLPAAATTITQFLALPGATASDNCTAQGDLTVTSVTGPVVGTQCNGTITRTYTIRDLCNNSTSVDQVFTVTDNTIPVATAPPARSIEGCTELTALPQPKQIVVAPGQAPETYYVDRYAPYGFSVVNYLGVDRLKHEINASDCETCRPGGYNSVFYNTQGRKYDTPDALSLAIDLYIPSDWATTNKRMAGLWGTAVDASNGISAYPIVEFTSDGGVPRFRGWNSDPGGWIDMGLPTGFAYNNWYTISIKLVGDKFVYQVGDLKLIEDAFGSVSISNMILQGHNNLTGVTYDIYWDNFKTSGVKLAYTTTPVTITESQYSAEGGSAIDNCVGIDITYQDSKAGTCPIVVTRTFNITDVCGNPVTKTQTIQIDDTQPPVLTGTAYSDATVYNACRANAQATVPTFNGANAIIGYTDNCGQAVTAEWTQTTTTGDDCSWVVTYTYSVKDECNNVLANRTYSHSGKDLTAPTLTGTAYTDPILYNACKANAQGAVPAFNTANAILGYTDNCGGAVTATLSNTDVSGTDCNWTVTYTYTLYDACLNPLANRSYSHSGKDQTAPTASNPAPLTLQCFSEIPAQDPVVVIDEADNCGGTPVVSHQGDANNGGSGSASNPYILTRTYRVTDGCGNINDVTQTITVSDNTIPVITMLGTTPVYICQGETYTDAGATALDNCDGNITAQIAPVSTVNTAIPGSYTVTYYVSDSKGNPAIPVVRTVEVQSKPFISNTVTAPDGYSQVMVSGSTYTRTACSHEELTTSVPTLTSTLANACGTLRIQTVYTSTLPNIPSATVDVSYVQAQAAGPQTISPENHTLVNQTIMFVTTPYYDADGSGSLTAGDILGDLTTFTLTVQPMPSISNTVTAPDGYSQVMVSGSTYTRTACSHEELTTSVPTLTSTLANACGTLRIQTVYTSTLPNIPSATVDVSYVQAQAAGPQTISPENHTLVNQTIMFVTTPYYDADGSGSLTVGDILGDLTTFTLTVQPMPSISNTVTAPDGYSQVMVSGSTYTRTACSHEELTTSVPTLTSTLANACGTLRIQTVYTSTLPNIPSATVDVSYVQAQAAGPQTISPENHTLVNQTIMFVTTPYYDADGSGSLTAGDILGDLTTFTLTVQPMPSISNTVTAPDGYSQVMVSGSTYTRTACSHEELTTSVPTLTSTLANACGTLRIQTVYTSTLPNIPSATVDVSYVQAQAAGPQTISPENHTLVNQTIMFVTTPYYDADGSGSLTAGDILGDLTTFTLTVQPMPSISNTVTAPDGYSQVMVSGSTYTRTACSHEELTTSVPTLTSTLANACGTLRIQTVYTSTLPNIPSATVDVSYVQAQAAGPQTISPENHTLVNQTIMFVTTPYYDADGSGSLTAGDILGDLTTFTLTVQPMPSISNTVTAPDGYSQVMVSGSTYTRTACSHEELTTSVPTLTSTLANACGTLRIQTVYTSTLPNIPSATVDVSYVQAQAAGPQTISPENHTLVNQTIMFVTTPYYDADGSGSLTAGDILGDLTTFTLTVQPMPSISNTVTAPDGYSQVMVSGGSYVHTICSGEEVTTTAPTLTSALATACGDLRVQTVYTSTLPNIPSSTVDQLYTILHALPPTTISPENHTNGIQTITFVTTPYYDVDGSETLTAGDVLGDLTTFELRVLPAPVVTCPANIVVNNDPGSCGASVAFAATSTGIPTPSITYKIGATTITSPYNFPGGITSVDVTSSNACGTSICSFTVTVIDTEDPVITCKPDQTRQANTAGCKYTVNGSEFDPVSFTDNCPGATITNSFNNLSTLAGVVFNVGTSNITWTVTDASANVKTCTFEVIISEKQLQVFNVTGGGTSCANELGVLVGLSGSEIGVNYLLYRDGTGTGDFIFGTGASIDFGNQTISGTYTIKAIHAITACTEVPMTGSAVVTINPVPDATISGTATVVQNAPLTPVITFTGSGGTAPYTFEYKVNGGPTQFVTTVSGNSTTVAQSNAVVGTFIYTLHSVTDNNGCTKTFSEPYPSATIIVISGGIPDITPEYNISGTSFANGESKDVAVRIRNFGTGPTTAPVVFTINKMTGVFNIAVNPNVDKPQPNRKNTNFAKAKL